jgi:hypothetical protein
MNPDTQGMTEKCGVHSYSKDKDLLRDILNTAILFHIP